MYFLMTNDVEAHSLSLNREDLGTVDLVHKVGLPQLLDLLSRHDVSSTFYFTGMFAEASPESVELVLEHGHRDPDVMGMIKHPQRHYDLLGYEEQVNELKKAKGVIEPARRKDNIFSGRLHCGSMRIRSGRLRRLDFHRIARLLPRGLMVRSHLVRQGS